MKHETTRYVSKCDTCRKVKADYMKPRGLLQPLSMPAWKWDDISMNFIVGLSLTACKFNLIWMIMDRLTKFAHFILSTPTTTLRSMPRSISLMCYVCMELQRRSSLIEDYSLLLTSGNNCMKPLEHT
jgi:hypothetical protein